MCLYLCMRCSPTSFSSAHMSLCVCVCVCQSLPLSSAGSVLSLSISITLPTGLWLCTWLFLFCRVCLWSYNCLSACLSISATSSLYVWFCHCTDTVNQASSACNELLLLLLLRLLLQPIPLVMLTAEVDDADVGAIRSGFRRKEELYRRD